jgi:hypothetical protein
VTEAKEFLGKAQKTPEVEEFVHQVVSSIPQMEEQEEERFKKIQVATSAARKFYLRRYEVAMQSASPVTAENIEGVWQSSTGNMTFSWQDNQLKATFKTDGLWDWSLTGTVDRRIYAFRWKNDHRIHNTNGTGYLFWPTDDRFEGIAYDYPTKGEVLTFSGDNRSPLPPKVQVSDFLKNLPRLSE